MSLLSTHVLLESSATPAATAMLQAPHLPEPELQGVRAVRVDWSDAQVSETWVHADTAACSCSSKASFGVSGACGRLIGH
jgi:hypothetical protein